MKKGQTIILLLVFMTITVTLTTATVIMSIINSVGNTKLQQGVSAYTVAESGIENALLPVLRDPNYTGETLPVGPTGTATIQVSNGVIISTGKVGNFVKRIQVTFTLDKKLTISSWKQIE